MGIEPNPEVPQVIESTHQCSPIGRIWRIGATQEFVIRGHHKKISFRLRGDPARGPKIKTCYAARP